MFNPALRQTIRAVEKCLPQPITMRKHSPLLKYGNRRKALQKGTHMDDEQPTRWGFISCYFIAVCLLMIVAVLQPVSSGRVAVFAPPWSDRSAVEIIAAAGGRIVSTSESGMIAMSEADHSGFVPSLYANGAIFVGSAVAIAACLNLPWATGNTQ